jgi:hypothetical protein
MVSVAPDASPQSVRVTVTTGGGSVTSSAIFTIGVPGVAVTAPQPIPTVEQGSIQSGYVIVTPDSGSAAPVPTLTYGMVNNGQVSSQASILPAAMSTSVTLFVEVVPSIGRDLGVAIANPSGTANVVSLALQDQNGLTVATTSVTLQPQQQLARFLTELFGSAIGSGMDGSLHLASSTPFSIVGLRFNGGNFSTVPVTESETVTGVPSRTFTATIQANTPQAGNIGGDTAVVLPQFATGGHWASVIALVNNGDTDVSGRIDILDPNGNPMAVNLNYTVQSTFRYAIPAGGVFILAPRDTNGQSPM